MNIIEFWPNTSKRYNQKIDGSLDSYCPQLSSQVCANQSLSPSKREAGSLIFFIGSCPITKRLKDLSTIQNCGKHIEAQKHLCTLIISLNCWINLNSTSLLYFMVSENIFRQYLDHFDFTLTLLERSVFWLIRIWDQKEMALQWIYNGMRLSKQKLHHKKLNRQGRHYSKLLWWGIKARIQSEFNCAEIKGPRVLRAEVGKS